MQKDSSIYNEEFDQSFDAVLCDVPCSGYGVIKDNPDIKLRRTEEDIKNLNQTIQNLKVELSKISDEDKDKKTEIE